MLVVGVGVTTVGTVGPTPVVMFQEKQEERGRDGQRKSYDRVVTRATSSS